MALLSDIDWLIILAVGGYLLFGRGNPQAMRTLGRWYGRASRLKQELLGEVARAADLPLPTGQNPGSLRAALLGMGSVPRGPRGIPVAVRSAPPVPAPAAPQPADPAAPWSGGTLVTGWSSSVPSIRPGEEGWR